MTKKRRKAKCEGRSPICSGSMIRRYSVNGSEEATGETFALCGACKVYLGRMNKLKEAKS